MLRLVAGLLLTIGTWVALRWLVGARRSPTLGVWLLDALPTLLGFVLFLIATGRPILSGLGIASLGFGLGLTDQMKRKILKEPVVFADRAELLDVVRHPRFYIAFVGVVPMLLGTVALLALVLAILWAEPPLWHAGPWMVALSIVLATVIGRLAFVLPANAPLLGPLYRLYLRWAPTRDPDADAARFGMLAGLAIQATIARAERPSRQAMARAAAFPPMPKGQGPIIFWQAESFVDVGVLDPDLIDRLPAYGRLKAEAALSGRLSVPAWGANTIRTELAAIAGISGETLGLDCFNPYDAFVGVPLPSLAETARAAGYRTVCVHPYSRTFYNRHKVIPRLGFDRFIGIEAFAGAEMDGGYVTDVALAAFVADLVASEADDLFVFVISIENHGPWDEKHDHVAPATLPAVWEAYPDVLPLARWLRHIEATDRAVAGLRFALEAKGKGWLGIYGDHQPSLAGPFDDTGRTDYLLWQVGRGAGEQSDVAASDLARTWLGLMASQV